jgi:AhpD family alkylhydroperoxidase
MNSRLDLMKYINSGLGKAMLHFSGEAEKRLERPLFELVKIRASQINGCAFCLDMHTKDARAAGETEQRIYALNAWRETPFFTERERAALEWTEAVSLVADTHVPDETFERVSRQFTEDEMVALTFGVMVINSWNRLNVSFRTVAGTYQPAKGSAGAAVDIPSEPWLVASISGRAPRG